MPPAFYAGLSDPRRFHSDRRMLLYALTWPATWLDRRGLTCPPRRYRQLVAERLDAIRAHGNPECYGTHFPRYLLKCLQDSFEPHGDDLYGDLKHLPNALDQVLASARFAEPVRDDARRLDVLVATHRLLHARRTAPVAPASTVVNRHRLRPPQPVSGPLAIAQNRYAPLPS